MAGGKDTGGKKEHSRFYVASLARESTDKAIKLLVDVVDDVKQKMSDRIKASEVLLDRGWGKAPQEIKLGNVDGDTGVKLVVEIIDATKPYATAERSQSQEPRAADQDTTGEHNKPAT